MSNVPIGMLKKQRLKGSLSLEAALLMPLTLVLILFVVGLLYLQAAELQLRWALDQCGRECAALIPLAEKAGEAMGEKGEALIARLFDEGEREWLDSLTRDIGSSLLAETLLERRLDRQLEAKRASGGLPLPPHQRRIFAHLDPKARALILELEFSFPVYPGTAKRRLLSLVPLWTERMPKEGGGENAGSEEDSRIWEADNFSRGRYFRKREGGTLPEHYPVIADFQGGRARAIKSMDLTAPSYQSPEAALLTLESHLKKLAAFQGYQSKNNRLPDIAAEEIQSRELVLVIPENSPDLYDAAFWERARSLVVGRGIELRVSRRGESRRYSQE